MHPQPRTATGADYLHLDSAGISVSQIGENQSERDLARLGHPDFEYPVSQIHGAIVTRHRRFTFVAHRSSFLRACLHPFGDARDGVPL